MKPIKKKLGNFGGRRLPSFPSIGATDFFTIYVFEVKESIVDIPTELRGLSDLENPSQLPV